jgi:hypothetical protein
MRIRRNSTKKKVKKMAKTDCKSEKSFRQTDEGMEGVRRRGCCGWISI